MEGFSFHSPYQGILDQVQKELEESTRLDLKKIHSFSKQIERVRQALEGKQGKAEDLYLKALELSYHLEKLSEEVWGDRKKDQEKINQMFSEIHNLDCEKYLIKPTELYDRLFSYYETLIGISEHLPLSLKRKLDPIWALFYDLHFECCFPILSELQEECVFPTLMQALQEILTLWEQEEKEGDILYRCLSSYMQEQFMANVAWLEENKLPFEKLTYAQKQEALFLLVQEIYLLKEIAQKQYYQEEELTEEEKKLIYKYVGEDGLDVYGKALSHILLEQLQKLIY